MPAREEMADLQEAVDPAFRRIMDQLEDGELHHVAAVDALDFLFSNWTQAIRLGEIEDDGCRTENLIDSYDRLVELLKELRPAVREALAAADSDNTPGLAP